MVTETCPDHSRLQSLISTLQFGDHLYHSYEKSYSQLPLLASFLASGLKRNQQCLHISADPTEEAVMNELRTLQVDAAGATQDGALRFLSKWQWRLQEKLDPAVMLEGLTALVSQGRQGGYTGARIWFDMTWTLHPGVDPVEVEVWETLLHRIIQDEPVLAVCSYNRRRLPAATIKAGQNTHPWCINGNRLLPNEHSRLAALFAKHSALLRHLAPPSRPRLADAW
jgi:hypothetical protein